MCAWLQLLYVIEFIYSWSSGCISSNSAIKSSMNPAWSCTHVLVSVCCRAAVSPWVIDSNCLLIRLIRARSQGAQKYGDLWISVIRSPQVLQCVLLGLLISLSVVVGIALCRNLVKGVSFMSRKHKGLLPWFSVAAQLRAKCSVLHWYRNYSKNGSAAR